MQVYPTGTLSSNAVQVGRLPQLRRKEAMSTKLPKYVATQLSNKTFPLIIVWHDKHESMYYLAHNKYELGSIYLAILRQRIENNYINPPPSKPWEITNPELTEEAANALPEPYRQQALKDLKRNAAAWARHRDEVLRWEQVCEADADNNGELAYFILRDRNAYEYERISEERPSKV